MRKSNSLAFALLFVSASFLRADIFETVTTNTSAFAASSGYIDFQFNPSAAGAPAATVTVNQFFTDGTLGGSASLGLALMFAFRPRTRRIG